jgi:hypothetical protein
MNTGRKVLLCIIVINLFGNNYGQIVADHSVVDKYDDIPQQWIDSVKRMWVSVTGASHAEAYRMGCWQLGQEDSRFPAATNWQGEPLPYRSTALRINGSTWGNYDNETGWTYMNGQDDWWTNDIARSRIKNYLQYCHDTGPSLYATIYGWSFDAQFDFPPGGDYDEVYHVRWAGSTRNGPDGNARWGLDSDDYSLTGNRVCMDTYLETVQEYIDYCSSNNIPTKIIYSTGAVDDNGTEGWSSGERGYQQFLKWDHIRNFVSTAGDVYLFDYADILSHNDLNELQTTTWLDNSGTLKEFPIIHPDNLEGGDIGHIGYNGAVRLGKALWWLLARMAGWDGTVNGEDITPPSVPSALTLDAASLNSITISWNSSSDNVAVTGYNVFRNGILLEATTETGYTDNTLTECNQYTYTVSSIDGAGNESEQSQGLQVSNCYPDITPTLIVSPNISHGIATIDVIIRVTELNNVNTDGSITVNIPADGRWEIEEGYNPLLEVLNETVLDNNEWFYTRGETNHIFTSSTVIPAGGHSRFGFTIVFNPDTSRGYHAVTSQVIPGSGGEMRGSNNTDSERLDYFQ